jgi:hypothetical protein
MNEQKSLIYRLAETYEHYRIERRASASEQDAHPRQAGRLRGLLRWFVPNGGTLLLVAALILTQQVWARPLLSPASAPGPSATTVNYQGRLADHSGNPLNGTYGMTFSLWDAATAGNLVWGPESHAAVPVSQGLFSVGLGSQTTGGIPTSAWNGDRYLQITVGGENLSPRELIRSVPIAGMALTVPSDAIGINQLAAATCAQAVQSPEVHITAPVTMEGWNVYKPFPDFAVTVNVTRASQILVVASAVLHDVVGGSGHLYAGFQKNGVQMETTHRWMPIALSGEVWAWNFVDSVSPGTYTYRLEGMGVNGMAISWYRPSISVVVIPVKD